MNYNDIFVKKTSVIPVGICWMCNIILKSTRLQFRFLQALLNLWANEALFALRLALHLVPEFRCQVRGEAKG